jgi:hypothetical protein
MRALTTIVIIMSLSGYAFGQQKVQRKAVNLNATVQPLPGKTDKNAEGVKRSTISQNYNTVVTPSTTAVKNPDGRRRTATTGVQNIQSPKKD